MRILLPTVLALVVGFVGGFFVHEWLAPPTSQAASFVERGADDSTPVRQPSSGLESVDARATSATDRGAREDGLAQREIEQALSRTAAPEFAAAPTGTGVIAGRIVDADDQPLAGVRVALHRDVSRRIDAAESGSRMPTSEDGVDLDTALRLAAEDWARTHGGDRTVVTGSDGRFRFDALSDCPFRLEPALEGWSFEAEDEKHVWAGDEDVVFTGTRLARLRLELFASGGRVVDEALVSVRHGRDRRQVRWTPDDPYVLFPGGVTRIQARADIFEGRAPNEDGILAGLVSEEIRTSARPGVDVTERLELFPVAVLWGRVLGDDRIVRPIFAEPLDDGETFDPELGLEDADSHYPNGGSFIFRLTPGRYAVGVYGEENEPTDWQVVEVAQGWNEIELERSPADLSRTIRVTPLADDGLRLDDVNYRFEWTVDDGETKSEGMGVHRDVDGVDLIEFDNFGSFDIEDWPAGTRMWLVGQHVSFAEARVPYAQGQTEATLNFVAPTQLFMTLGGFEPGRRVSVEVRLAPKNAADDGRVLAHAAPEHGSPRISPDGRIHFRNLPLGLVEIRLLGGGQHWWGGGAEILRRDLTLTEDDNHLTIDLPALHNLTLEITPEAKHRYLELFPADDPDADTIMAVGVEDGRARFRGLPAGSYIVKDALTSARLEVSLPTGTVHWDLSNELLAVTITVSDREGWLASQGLEGGDVVTAVDGEPLDPEGEFLDVLRKSAHTLTVLRGDTTVQLEVDRLEIETSDWDRIGGWIRRGR